MSKSCRIAISGLHRGENPQPGAGIIHSLRRQMPGAHIIGLAYDVMESDIYAEDGPMKCISCPTRPREAPRCSSASTRSASVRRSTCSFPRSTRRSKSTPRSPANYAQADGATRGPLPLKPPRRIVTTLAARHGIERLDARLGNDMNLRAELIAPHVIRIQAFSNSIHPPTPKVLTYE